MQKQSQLRRKDCPSFKRCSAPLCPLAPDLENGMWYPDEKICMSIKIKGQHPWIRTQKKIARKTKNPDKYFTIQMLKRLWMVRKGTVGLNPNRDKDSQLKIWLKNHPPRKKEQLAKMRERAKKARAGSPIGKSGS